MTQRLLVGARALVLGGLLLVIIGLLARWFDEPMLAGALGPTLYVLLVHPGSEQARLRNAILGHGAAVGLGVAMLAAFGLTTQQPQLTSGQIPTARLFAVALAVGLTMLVLEVFVAHHAPAAATAMLVASGISRPGAPLIGLVLGLAGVIALGPVLARFPLFRSEADHPS